MAEAGPEALQYKTLFLKVSIHCEGCKKKVRRVLQNIDGVYKVEIDSLQHKVTVTGSVDHEMLIRRLNKSGKQASIWPEAKKPGGDQKPTSSNDTRSKNNESNSKPKDKEPKESSENLKEKQPEPANDKGSDKGHEKEKEKEKPKTEETISKPQEKEKEKEKEKAVEKEMEKPKEKEKEKPKEQSEQEATQSNSGKNKKEKKEQNEKENESSGKEGGQPVAKGLNPMQPNQEFMYPSYSYPYPPQPIMSYHMAQPSSSQAYYQQPPMPGMQGYMYPDAYQNPHPYPYPYPYGAPSEFNYGTAESSTRGEDTFGYFNEENANSCSVM